MGRTFKTGLKEESTMKETADTEKYFFCWGGGGEKRTKD